MGAQFVSNIGSWMQTVAAQWLMLTLTSSATYVALAPALGSPYEDRLHGARGEQAWPGAGAGDIVVIMQIEIEPPRLDEALSLAEELAAAQSADAAMNGQVLLQRRCRPSNLELISVWSSSEAFEEHLASGSAQAPRSVLASRLVAPIDVRPHRLFAGGWTTP